MLHPKWKILKTEDVSPSPWFPMAKDTVELPTGQQIEYFKSLLESVAMVVPVTRDRNMVFVKQYKHGVGEVCIEFPAGRIQQGKSAEDAAVAELLEETGIKIDPLNLKPLLEIFPEPSKSTLRVHGFLATDVTFNNQQHLEETEHIEILQVPLWQVHEFVREENVCASDTLALLYAVEHQFPELLEK